MPKHRERKPVPVELRGMHVKHDEKTTDCEAINGRRAFVLTESGRKLAVTKKTDLTPSVYYVGQPVGGKNMQVQLESRNHELQPVGRNQR